MKPAQSATSASGGSATRSAARLPVRTRGVRAAQKIPASRLVFRWPWDSESAGIQSVAACSALFSGTKRAVGRARSGETAVPVVGRPFPKGVSGNPGGRPKGLARYVRELVGDDGRRIADFMLSVLDDETERTETRLKAADWLAERGFGKAPLTMDATVNEPTTIVVRSMFDVEPKGVSLADILRVARECESEVSLDDERDAA